jgi:hypothetical protein
VEVERVGEVIKINAAIPVAANSVVAWEVLTDYNRLADFVPGMQSSRVVSAPGASIRVEQEARRDFSSGSFPWKSYSRSNKIPPAVSASNRCRET